MLFKSQLKGFDQLQSICETWKSESHILCWKYRIFIILKSRYFNRFLTIGLSIVILLFAKVF